jgi:hypothetical protein
VGGMNAIKMLSIFILSLFIAYFAMVTLSPLGEIVGVLKGALDAVPDRLRN